MNEARVWTHQNLCEDLALHLTNQGYMTWVEVRRVGVVSYGDAGRIDVMALAPWTGRTKFDMIAFEVKVSRSDLLRDLVAGKWRRYGTEYGVPRVAFACAEGIAKSDDMPAEAGLWVREGDGWKRKSAPRSLNNDQRKIDPLLLLAMLTNPRTTGPKVRSWRQLAETLPEQIRALVEKIDDRWLYDYVGRRASREIGQEFARRLRRDEAAKVNAWAESMAAWLGKILDMEGADFLRSALYGDEFRPPAQLERMLHEARALAQRGDLIAAVLDEARSLMHAWGEIDPETDRVVLDAMREAKSDRGKAKQKRKRAS